MMEILDVVHRDGQIFEMVKAKFCEIDQEYSDGISAVRIFSLGLGHGVEFYPMYDVDGRLQHYWLTDYLNRKKEGKHR